MIPIRKKGFSMRGKDERGTGKEKIKIPCINMLSVITNSKIVHLYERQLILES